MARTFASLAAYLATADRGGLQIHQYAGSRICTSLEGGRKVGVEITTSYPREGRVTVRITESDGQPWALTLRVPAWATGAEVVEPGGRRPAAPGSVVVERAFKPGDEVTLVLPLVPRWTMPDLRIDAIRGCVAVERGPLVMCAESIDLGDRSVDELQVDPSVLPRDDDSAVVVEGRFLDVRDQTWPYGDGGDAAVTADADVRLVPYHDWANRGPSTMRVWLPTAAV